MIKANMMSLKQYLEKYHKNIYEMFLKNKVALDQRKLTDMLTRVSPRMFYVMWIECRLISLFDQNTKIFYF